MEYISSDTNVWLDFVTIDRLDYPFRLFRKQLLYWTIEEIKDCILIIKEYVRWRLLKKLNHSLNDKV